MFTCVVFLTLLSYKKIRLFFHTDNFEKDLLSRKILLHLRCLFLPVYMQIYHLSIYVYSNYP